MSRSVEEIKQWALDIIENTQLYNYKGTVSKVLGLTVEVKLPGLRIGDLCFIETSSKEKKAAEVVAFKGDVAQLLLLYDGAGIGQGSLVSSTGKPIIIPVGDFLLGRLVNPLGVPIDGKKLDTTQAKWIPIEAAADP
jgi:flagellum-specific ATP synthase